MPVTLGHIAAATGMSLPTVSQILNNKGHYRPETRARIIAVAKQLGYQPNATAKAMVSRRFGCYALVLSSRPSSSLLAYGMVEAIDEALTRLGLHLIVTRLPDEQLTDSSYVPKILSHVLADGLIVNYNAGLPSVMVELISAHHVPAVWLNSLQTTNAVRPDDHAAGVQAASLLLTAQHHRIAWIDLNLGLSETSMHYSSVHRRGAFCSTLASAGLEVWPVSHQGGVPFAERLAYVRGILAAVDRPTAIACYGPQDAEVVCAAALATGLDIPRDLSLIVIGDRNYAFAGREIDTLRIDGARIGAIAVERLAELVVGRPPAPPDVVPMIHCERGTVAEPAT